MSKEYKPFDLEAAKAGKPITFGNGTPATFLTTVIRGAGPLHVAVKYKTNNSENVVIRSSDGGGTKDGYSNSSSLFMKPEVREHWASVVRYGKDFGKIKTLVDTSSDKDAADLKSINFCDRWNFNFNRVKYKPTESVLILTEEI